MAARTPDLAQYPLAAVQVQVLNRPPSQEMLLCHLWHSWTCKAYYCESSSILELMATLLAYRADGIFQWPVRACMAWHLRGASDVGLQEATGAVDAAFFIQRHAD